MATALRAAGHDVAGPLSRGERPPAGTETVLICVPDAQIAAVAALLAEPLDGTGTDVNLLVGHCSGATGLGALTPHEAFSLHPLMTVVGETELDVLRLRGSAAAIAGTTPRALAAARALALAVGLAPVEIDERDRAVYHAAATFASNFLITVEAAAELLAARAGVSREQLLPLVEATIANWGRLGAEGALTGPIARGDEATVERQRAAVAEHAPALVDLFDALCDATRELAGTRPAELAA